jgi:hypothetical protein
MIYRSINKFDLETLRNGLEEIVKHAENVFSVEKEKWISEFFCDPLIRIARLAARKDDVGLTIEVIKKLQDFGVYTANAETNAATELVAAYLGAVGKISVEKGKAFEGAVMEVVFSFEVVGKTAAEKGLEDATKRVASSLEAIGKTAAEKGLEDATKQVALSLLAVCNATMENELEAAAQQAASALASLTIISKEIVKTAIHNYESKLRELDHDFYLNFKELYVHELKKRK